MDVHDDDASVNEACFFTPLLRISGPCGGTDLYKFVVREPIKSAAGNSAAEMFVVHTVQE